MAGCQGKYRPSHITEVMKRLYYVVMLLHIICSSASVVEQLELGEFFSKSVTKRHLFATVHDAVLYCLNNRGATSFPRCEPSVVSLIR